MLNKRFTSGTFIEQQFLVICVSCNVSTLRMFCNKDKFNILKYPCLIEKLFKRPIELRLLSYLFCFVGGFFWQEGGGGCFLLKIH